jgi:APA family basic amino acid/polyamine antiporter
MICGAGFALISTLNSQYAWAPKGIMQACDDGWLPSGLAKMSKWNTPIILLSILYGLGIICIITGLDVSILGNMSLIANGMIYLLINACVWKLPSICPEAWEKSKFKCSAGKLRIITVIGTLGALFAIYLNATTLSPALLGLNVVLIIGSFIFSFARCKHAKVDVSYEEV